MKKVIPTAVGLVSALFLTAQSALCAAPQEINGISFSKVRPSTAWSEVEGSGFSGICPNLQDTTVGTDLLFSNSGERAVHVSANTMWKIKDGKFSELQAKDPDFGRLANQMTNICGAFISGHTDSLPTTDYMEILFAQMNSTRMDSIKTPWGHTRTAKESASDPQTLSSILDALRGAPKEIRNSILKQGTAPDPKLAPNPEHVYQAGDLPDEVTAFHDKQKADAEAIARGEMPAEPATETQAVLPAEHQAGYNQMSGMIGTKISGFGPKSPAQSGNAGKAARTATP